jgi:hypothetical protein
MNFTRPSNRKSLTSRPGPAHPALAALLVIAAAALLGGCEINKPEMPTFDTRMIIPLGVERVEVLDLVEDEEFLVVGSDSSLSFFIDGDPDTLAFEFDLAVDFPDQSIQQGVGNFSLPAADPMAYSFVLSDIWPAAEGMVSQPAIVPPFPIAVASDGQDLPDIDSATLDSGSVEITVTNGLPVPISAASGPDQVVLDLVDPGTGQAFATFVFPAIAPGGSSTRSADLAGVQLPGDVAVVLSGGSPGSSGSLVTVNGTDSIDISAAFTDLVVTQAMAVVGAQSFTAAFDTALPEDYAITQAVIDQGAITLTLANDMPVPCTAQVIWPNLKDMAQQPLTATFALAPHQTAQRSIDFSGYVIDADGQALSQLPADVLIDTPGSGGGAVALDADSGLTADISGGSLSFSSITGLVPSYSVDIDPIVEEIDLPDELDGLQLTAATMVLSLTNSAGLPGDLDLTLTGTSATGQVRSLQVSRTIAPALERAPITTEIVLDESNSGIIDFLNNLPETITLGGSVLVGGDGTEGTVRPDDFAVVAWDIRAPVEVIIDGSTFAADPQMVDLDQDMRDMVADHALGARIQTEILNHLPVGVQLRILAGTDLATLESDPLLVIGPLEVAAAQVDPITHCVAEAVVSTPVVELTAEQAQLFSLPGLLTTIEVVLPSTGGEPVRMMTSDFLEVRGVVQVDVLVNDEW